MIYKFRIKRIYRRLMMVDTELKRNGKPLN